MFLSDAQYERSITLPLLSILSPGVYKSKSREEKGLFLDSFRFFDQNYNFSTESGVYNLQYFWFIFQRLKTKVFVCRNTGFPLDCKNKFEIHSRNMLQKDNISNQSFNSKSISFHQGGGYRNKTH